MAKPIQNDAQWDDEAHVSIATGCDAPDLVVEAEPWRSTIDEARAVSPELLALNEGAVSDISLTFKAETHLARAAD